MFKSKTNRIIASCAGVLGVVLIIWFFLFIFKSCVNDQSEIPSWQTVRNNFCQEYRGSCSDICPTPTPTPTEPTRTACDMPFSSAANCSAWKTRCLDHCKDIFDMCACGGCCAAHCQYTLLCNPGGAATDADCRQCTEANCLRLKTDCQNYADRMYQNCIRS